MVAGDSNVDTTPLEVLYGRRPNLAHLRKIGSVAYAHIPSANRDKMGNRAVKCYLVGYAHLSSTKAYTLWDPARHRCVTSRDVTFDESHGPDKQYQQNPTDLDLLEPEQESPEEPEKEYVIDQILDERPSRAHRQEYLVLWQGYQNPSWEPQSFLEDTEALDRWENRVAAYATSARTFTGGEPAPAPVLTWKQAMSSPEAGEYRLAAEKEYQSLLTSGTRTVV